MVATAQQPLSTQETLVAKRTTASSTGAAYGGQASKARNEKSILERTISLHLSRVSVEEALRAVSRQTEMGLAYSRDILPTRKFVSIDDKEISVGDALQIILRGTNLTASVSASGQITIVPAATAKKQNGKGTITGVTSNAKTKRVIEGVHIALEGTQISIRTNEEGRFVLSNVPAGVYTIVARGVGYTRKSREIEVKDGQVVTVDFLLEETVNTLNEIVVTSTVAETELKAVPVDVTRITADQIARKNITRMDQIFRGDIPGVFTNDEGYLSLNPRTVRTPYVRGQNFLSAQTDSRPSYLKTYIDGVLVTDYSVVSQLDPATIESIEIVRGPAASTMYGSGASDGVMQIFTKRGRGAQKPRLTLSLVSTIFDSPYKKDKVFSPRAEFGINGGSDAFSYSGSMFVAKQGAWVPSYKNLTRGFNGGVQWTSGPLSINATVGYNGPSLFSEPPAPWFALGIREGILSRARVPETALIPTNEYTKASSQLGGVTVTYHANPKWTHHMSLGTNLSHSETIQDAPKYGYLGDTLLSLSNSNAQTNTFLYNNTWSTPLGSNFSSTLTTGVEYTSNWNRYTSVSGLLQPRGGVSGYVYGSRDETSNTGYFGQWVLGFRDKVFLTAGGRIEYNPDYGDDVKYQTAPRVGLTFSHSFPGVSVKTRVAYGWGTRPPLAYQKDGRPTSSYLSGEFLMEDVYLANDRLLASRNSGVDYGLDLYFGDFLSISATAFNQYAKKDVYETTLSIDTTDLVDNPSARYKRTAVHQYTNIGEVQTKGVELVGQLLWRNWSLTSTYSTVSNIIRSMPEETSLSWTYSSISVGQRFPWIPTYTGGTTLGYVTALLSANLQVTYQGRVRAGDQLDAFYRLYGVPVQDGPAQPGREIILPHWAKYHLNVNRRVSKNTSVFTSIQNLTNQRVVEGLDTRNPYAGRQITIGLRLNN
jgi:outer membrane receptor protein involved in Fe transport